MNRNVFWRTDSWFSRLYLILPLFLCGIKVNSVDEVLESGMHLDRSSFHTISYTSREKKRSTHLLQFSFYIPVALIFKIIGALIVRIQRAVGCVKLYAADIEVALHFH